MEFIEKKLKSLKKDIDEISYIVDYRRLEGTGIYVEAEASDSWVNRRMETFNKYYHSLRDEVIQLKEATEMQKLSTTIKINYISNILKKYISIDAIKDFKKWEKTRKDDFDFSEYMNLSVNYGYKGSELYIRSWQKRPPGRTMELLTGEVVEKHLRILKEKIQFGDE